MTLPPPKFKVRMLLGIKYLRKIFGIKPKFFVPPRDYITYRNLKVLTLLFDGIIVRSLTPMRGKLLGELLFPIFFPHASSSFLLSRVKGDNYIIIGNRFLVLEHRGLSFMPHEGFVTKLLEYIRRYRVIVIVTHHWAYTRTSINLHHKILRKMLATPRIQFLSITEVYRMLLDSKLAG